MKIQLANHRDMILAQAGLIAAADVRRAELEGEVDPAIMRMVLPTAVADQLGLPRVGKVSVRYADDRREEREVVGAVDLTLVGRNGVFSATLEPNRTTALVGAIVMEELDLLIDCANRSVYPRDPNIVIAEIG